MHLHDKQILMRVHCLAHQNSAGYSQKIGWVASLVTVGRRSIDDSRVEAVVTVAVVTVAVVTHEFGDWLGSSHGQQLAYLKSGWPEPVSTHTLQITHMLPRY